MNKCKLTVVTFLLSVLSPIFTFACSYNYISQCADYLNITAGGSSTDYYLNSCTYRTPFQNTDFGTVPNLSINLAEVITWESCDNDIMTAHLYYRIYEVGATPGAFLDFPVDNLVDQNAGNFRKKTHHSTATLDLLNGLYNGNYIIEAYVEVDVDTDMDGLVNNYLTANNSGSYYQAFFTVDGVPPPGGPALAVDFQNIVDVSCRDGADGAINTTITTGGTAPYTFAWSNGETTSTIIDLSAGDYILTVTDAVNDSIVGSVTIEHPNTLQAVATATNNASSPTAMDGATASSPTGGTAPYSFIWSSGETVSSLNNLGAGDYTVTVTDANGCTISQTVTINTSGPSTYCATSGVFPWVDWITNVNFAGLNNTSTKAPYTDYTNQSATVTKGGSYLMTIENGYSWFTYDEYFRVWIDYNRNGIFEEPSEIAFSSVLTAPAPGTTGGVTLGSVQIPSNVSSGSTRMRVSLKRGAYATPCEAIPNGEVEDYSIMIEDGVPIPCVITADPTNITCDNAGTTADATDDTFSFDLNVTGIGTGNGWIASIVNGPTVTGTYGTPYNLSGLLIADGDIQMVITDNYDSQCSTNFFISPPAACSNGSNCMINTAVSNIVCSDNGTNQTPVDDTFIFLLDVTGTDTGSGWIASYNGSTMTGSYGIPTIFGPFPIAVGDVDITIQDSSEPSCIVTETVSPPNTCSTPSTGVVDCISTSDYPWADWIQGVSVGTIVQPSSKSPYSDFTGISTDLEQGTTVDITLTTGFSWFTYDEYWSVWIDYNQDGIFDETTELAYSTSVVAPINGTLSSPVTGQISVPSTALLGNTKMRVTMKRDAAATPCEVIPFGEVEDYTINITAAGSTPYAVNHILRLEINEVDENADINFFGLIPAELISADIEKSYDGSNYFTLSENNPTEIGVNSIHLREMDYALEKGNNYYRVKVVGGDGTTRYSNPQLLYYQPKADYTLFPNPAQDFVTIGLPEMNGERVEVAIVGAYGQVLYSEVKEEQNERNLRISTADLIDGLYFVRVAVEGKRMVGKPLMVFRL